MSITRFTVHTAAYIGNRKERVPNKAHLPLCVLSVHKEEGYLSGRIAKITPPNFSVLVLPPFHKGEQTATEGPPKFKRADLSYPFVFWHLV